MHCDNMDNIARLTGNARVKTVGGLVVRDMQGSVCIIFAHHTSIQALNYY